jgi:hypothetical protein
MTGDERTVPRMVALFLLGVLLFNYPILALFNLPQTIFGIPLLYFHLFVAWAALIGLMAWVIERGGSERDPRL